MTHKFKLGDTVWNTCLCGTVVALPTTETKMYTIDLGSSRFWAYERNLMTQAEHDADEAARARRLDEDARRRQLIFANEIGPARMAKLLAALADPEIDYEYAEQLGVACGFGAERMAWLLDEITK